MNILSASTLFDSIIIGVTNVSGGHTLAAGANVDDPLDDEVLEFAVALAAAVSQVGPVMEALLSVTSAVRASALPFKLAPAANVILVSASMFPTSELFASNEAVLTTLHHTLHG